VHQSVQASAHPLVLPLAPMSAEHLAHPSV